jgi:hypothetical protein
VEGKVEGMIRKKYHEEEPPSLTGREEVCIDSPGISEDESQSCFMIGVLII